MKAKLDYFRIAPELMDAVLEMEKTAQASGIDPLLYKLIKIRASQLNGCAYCLDMHLQEARELGETQRRLDLVSVWPESPHFTPREKAALLWTERLTLIHNHHGRDEAFEAVSAHFKPKEIVALTLTISTINTWNRFAIAFSTPIPD